MSVITLSQAQAQLDALLTADTGSNGVKRVTNGDTTVEYADIGDYFKAIQFWERKVAELTAAAAGSSRSGVKLAKWS